MTDIEIDKQLQRISSKRLSIISLNTHSQNTQTRTNNIEIQKWNDDNDDNDDDDDNQDGLNEEQQCIQKI